MTPETPAARLRRLVAAHRQEILALADKHGATSIRLFGSVARGDASEESDVDFLVAWGPHARAFAQLNLRDDLEALLGVRVDIANEAALHRIIRDDVMREAVAV